MASVDASTLGPLVEEPAADPAEIQEEERPMTDVESAKSMMSSAKSMKTLSSRQSTVFHIPALRGWPNAGKASLRQRPILVCSNPRIRKHFTLAMYVMLAGQVAITVLIAFAITTAIVSGWLPKEIGAFNSPTSGFFNGATPHPDIESTGAYWMPGYPLNALLVLVPSWFCTLSLFVGLSCARGLPNTRRVLLVVATLATGISIGLFTYVEKSCAMLSSGIVLMSLVLHTCGIAVNFVSSVAARLGPLKPKASKMEIMARTSNLTGIDKFICMVNDEEAGCTRASLVLAALSWTVATAIASVIVAANDINWLPFIFAAIFACPAVIYFTYAVEKQARRCAPDEKEKAMVNLNVDLMFCVAGSVTVDLSIIRWQELGTARPCPVEKGVFQYAMKQVSSTTTQSTGVSSSLSQTAKTKSEQRVTIAV